MTAGFALAGLGAASVAHARPTPLPNYHWCPGQPWDPGWGNNWDWNRCHDDNYYDGDPHDPDHWHGPGGPGGWQPGYRAAYHWCPGQPWDPGWGNNWDWNRCHDDHYYDGDPHDPGHWH
ncbi:hypothetical protein JMUB5695_03806 [Mycobacterium heckeshornense]|uniref:Pilin n=1 Tax=Mycobacterium heckeshornense TaxID=110505 RepID=A0A7R7YSQ5_9MYCO|nr:hypothetical protein [Mycobacterium heckeshornense]MCV7033445.1 hypothetical protein [Mycobacterium heckeshornense]BCO37500.1 hypothetical protein MHEC_39330 [Mycobacterium heckeshornense]BCQ10351.1 hypothetical protein JMUB5695_03806 [Mycobacterium heckeshornense]